MTTAQFGALSLVLSLLACIYSVGGCALGSKTKRSQWIDSATYALYLACALLTLASLLMWFSLLTEDYSIKYVYHSVERNMHWMYKLAAFWGGLDGSMMFWAWLLSCFSSIAVYQNHKRHANLMPIVIGVLSTLLMFFVGLLVFYKKPFATFLDGAPLQGKGLNPLLQDPYMATHPPSLYIGYVSTAIPFAFAIAALVTGRVGSEWLQSVRRWVLVSFYFLSQGLVLGGFWAYRTLGWSGFWAWDPVENAGLLPWMTAVAFLHSMRVQERRDMLKIWNLLLVIFTFLLTMIGTFLTRSGVVTSVHAFGQDQALTIAFSSLILLILVGGFGLLIYRVPQLKATEQFDSWLSKDFFFLLNNWILLGISLFVLVATVFPIITEAFHRGRVTVSPEFFNRFLGPLGIILLFLTATGPLLAWRMSSVGRLVRQFVFPISCTIVISVLLAVFRPGLLERTAVFSEKIQLPLAFVCFSIVTLTLAGVLQEFVLGTRSRMKTTGTSPFVALGGLISRNRRRYGGYLAHVGLALMFLGFAGGAYKKEKPALLTKGGQVTLQRYTLTYEDFVEEQQEQKIVFKAKIALHDRGVFVTSLEPAKWAYRVSLDQPARTIAAIYQIHGEDVYVILEGVEQASEGKQELPRIQLKVFLNPLVQWVWIGFVWLAVGTAVAFLPEVVRRRKKKAVLAAVFLCGWLGGQTVNAHEHKGMNQISANSEEEKKTQESLVCLCGDCSRLKLATCTCNHAAEKRRLISALFSEGKSRQQIMDIFRQNYGVDVLSEPPNQGGYRLIWLFPLVCIVVGLGVLVRQARRRKLPPASHLPIAPQYYTAVDEDLRKSGL